MASEKGMIVLATFFIVMSLTTNVGYAVDSEAIELYTATILNILASLVKAGMKRDVLGMTSLGASVVADIHLIAAVVVLLGSNGSTPVLAKGLAFGAIFANVVSIALMLIESYFEAKKEYSE